MVGDLQDEIKQGKPFMSLKEEAWLNLLRTTAGLSHRLEQMLRPHGLSPTQYNVLRILRGAPRGLFQHEIRDRLVAQVPDVPRILERMERAGWILRTKGQQDRRMVIAELTEPGLAVVDALDAAMMGFLEGLFEQLGSAELAAFNEALVKSRH